MPNSITSISSPSKHSIHSQINSNKATVHLTEKTFMDRDFILDITFENKVEPSCKCELMPGRSDIAALLTFFPKFSNKNVGTEIIILLDRSGSMSGSRIASAASAIKNIISILPESVLVNIVGFGSTYSFLFSQSKPCTPSTKKDCFDHCNRVKADLGGTEIYQPLAELYKTKSSARQILVLTDGEVSNTQEIIALVQKHSSNINSLFFFFETF